ncbi:MAG: IS5 family transposase [Thermoleophilaceae bacterium]
MRALDPQVADPVWRAVQGLLPPTPSARDHPLGCHRRRASDELCFRGILLRLVTGCSWVTAERLLDGAVSDTTLRARRDEWLAAGVFDRLVEEALEAYNTIVGYDLDEVSIDGSQHKAPCGGPGTGPNCADRGKLGFKWSVAADGAGVPIGWVVAQANRHDSKLLEPTLDELDRRGLLVEVDTVHLDRGYDYEFVRDLLDARGVTGAIPKVRPKGKGRRKSLVSMGERWKVERANSWFTNFGQLRRNTDRGVARRLAQIALAVALLITAKLVDWRDRWN